MAYRYDSVAEIVDGIGITEDVGGGAGVIDDEEMEVGEMELAAVTGDIKGRLVAFQMKFLAPMKVNFDARIKILAVRPSHRSCSTFEKFPLTP